MRVDRHDGLVGLISGVDLSHNRSVDLVRVIDF